MMCMRKGTHDTESLHAFQLTNLPLQLNVVVGLQLREAWVGECEGKHWFSLTPLVYSLIHWRSKKQSTEA